MSSARRPSSIRQAELVEAALHLIATRGIAALSTRSLASEVGLSSGAIFRHFASIEDLLEAVVARVEAVFAASLPDSTLAPLARLERFLSQRSAAVGDELGILRLVVSEQFVLALPKGSAQRLASCVQQTRSFLTRCLREGQQRGDIRRDVAAETLVPIIMGAVQALALSTASPRHRVRQAHQVQATLETLLTPPRRPRRRS